MKTSILPLAIATFSVAASSLAGPGDRHFLFKATALFPVQIEKSDGVGGTVVTKLSLGTRELVNLALARPFDHPIDAKKEVLVVNVNESTPDETSLQVYKIDTNIVYTVCNISAGSNPSSKLTDKSGSDAGKGAGLGPGTIVATSSGFPLADRNKNSLQSTDVCASSTGSWTPGDHFPTFKSSATGIIGDIKGVMTSQKPGSITQSLDGLIIKGMFTGSGRPIEPFPFGYVE